VAVAELVWSQSLERSCVCIERHENKSTGEIEKCVDMVAHTTSENGCDIHHRRGDVGFHKEV